MSRILIVGAGQAGLQLGTRPAAERARGDGGLEPHAGGHPRRTGDVEPVHVRAALAHERELGLNFWEDECPPVEGISLGVPAPDGAARKAIDWASRLDRAGAVGRPAREDARAGWRSSSAGGGKLVIEDAGVEDLERYTQSNDLVIVAAGKGEIMRLFERDAGALAVRPADARARAHLRHRA